MDSANARGMWQPQAREAITEWRHALMAARPRVPFNQDKIDAAQEVMRNPRVAEALYRQRIAIHVSEGMDQTAARSTSKSEMEELANTLGRRR